MTRGHGAALRVGAVLCIAVAGCAKPPATQSQPKPERVFVRLQTLEAAHPLAASLRELDAARARLAADAVSPSAASVSPIRFAISAPVSSGAASRRGAVARAALLQSANETLRRYVLARARTRERIVAEKRAELAGIARARGLEQEAAARARIQDETRAALFARADRERDATIKRDAAQVNLNPGNVVSLAHDPETKLPSATVLEAQIKTLREREQTAPGTPVRVSDEARLTKLLRDWQAEIDRLRSANDRDTAFNNALIADAIATIRAENDQWVEAELAKTSGRAGVNELATLRRDLLALLESVKRTATIAGAGVGNQNAVPPPLPQAVAAPLSAGTGIGDTATRLAKERDALRNTIHRDVVSAVRDTGFARHLEPVFVATPTLSDRTADFSVWIFGNVRANPLSKQKNIR